MPEIMCATCGATDGHYPWCAVGQLSGDVAELTVAVAAKDRRIAELEEALASIRRHVDHKADRSDYEVCVDRCPACLCDAPKPTLDALLAQAKREGLADYLRQAREFSEKTFGPGRRTLGVTKHIEKEIAEVRAKPNDLTEWIDIIILACDGYWRHGGQPEGLLADMMAKLAKNKARKWPAPTSEDVPVEHDRTHDDPLNPELGPEHREYWVRRMAREVK